MDPLAGYPATVERELRRVLGAGPAQLTVATAEEYRSRGVTVPIWSDGRQEIRSVVLDPLPRVVTADAWAQLAAGVVQRHRALNAFLADAYRAAGRRRSDPDRSAEIVRAGVLPEWAVAHSPGRDPGAIGLAWPGQHRAAVAAADVVATASGEWTVVADHLQVPAGLGYALAARDGITAIGAGHFPPAGVLDCGKAVPMLADGLASATPPGCAGTPRIAVLTTSDGAGIPFEDALIARALAVPLVHPTDLWPRMDGGLEAVVDGLHRPVDVLYRRFGDAALGAYATPAGQPLDVLLSDAVRAGRLGLANVPGNGIADDAATFAWVPAMIRFYLGEEPLLPSLRTRVLADVEQWTAVRDRMREFVFTPVAGYGGGRSVAGPSCSDAELDRLRREISAAPHRFVAQEPVAVAPLATASGNGWEPRPASLRVFTAGGATVAALPAPLTCTGPDDGGFPALETGAATKDTWLLSG
jgi:carboxylate-amine ligase